MLEILNNRTEHTHENEQFRRVVDIIETTFDKLGYNGLLIGNPFNELYSRFRTDAILYYNNGIILIDFKDYKGIIKLPPNEDEFHSTKWYNESPKDRSRLEIKAGSNFINPFRQLVSYRNAFRELVEKNKYFDGINPARVCIANIFSGPIEIHNDVPKNLPYYKLIQESDLSNFLYDFASENYYKEENAIVFKSMFPAEKWIKNIEVSIPKHITQITQITEIENDIKQNIVDFLKADNGGIFLLESMNVEDRDSWFRFISNEAGNHNIPQVEKWSHSARISEKILRRSNIKTEGIYSIIYGGSDIEGQNENPDNEEEELFEVIPLKSSKDIDEKGLIIVAEAHLISRSLNQSELLRFGSGRLLEDVIEFLNPQSDRKIVFIADPYSLTFGKKEDSALNLDSLSELYNKDKIKHFRKPIENKYSNNKEKLRVDLAQSIENILFNNLHYHYDNTTLINLHDNSQRVQNLNLWFSKPFSNEPDNTVLFYLKKDCLITNKWIKKYCLKNGEDLAPGDLLIVNNNVVIPDETGFQIPKRIVNGMYFTVLATKETKPEPIEIKQSRSPIILSFTRISVKCLSLIGTPVTDIWMLDNYFNNEDELTKEEEIAFRVFVNRKIYAENTRQKFTESREYQQLLEDLRYKKLSENDKQFLKNNYHDLRKFKKEQEEAKKLLKFYKQKYNKRLFLHIKDTDPFINAVHVKYGWAITVHKAIGSNFNEIILKGHRKENDGITNDDYFRWLYSGVTTGKIVNITSPKIIHPFIDCVFEDNSLLMDVSIESKGFLIFEDYEVDKRFFDKTQSLDNINVIGATCEISKLLEQNGFILESTNKFTEYLTKAFYSIPQTEDKQLILNIYNKGPKNNFAVSDIRIENANGVDETIIYQSIKHCLCKNKSISLVRDDNPELPKDFRKDIYSAWIENCENENIALKLIQSHNNQDVFRAIREKEKLTFRVWYGTSEKHHTKGFFSKIEVLEKSSESILEQIKPIVYGY